MQITQKPAKKPNLTSGQLPVFMMRWYLRVMGILLIGYSLFLLLTNHPSLAEAVLVEAPLVVLGAVGIIISFGVQRTWVMDMLSLLITLLSGLFLFSSPVKNQLLSIIVSIGLDPMRAQLVSALLLTAGTALFGALIGQRILSACLGAGIVFWFGYLAGFIQLQLQPIYDPGGNLEPLNAGALMHTSIVIVALAILSAFIGAAVGVALAAVLLEPIYLTLKLFWRRYILKQQTMSEMNPSIAEDYAPPSAVRALIGPWLGAGLIITVLLLVSGSSELFSYTPDVGLHDPPQIGHSNQNIPTQGTLVQESMVSRVLGGQTKTFYVYLPPSYNTAQGQSKHYPTLYLLHGSPGSYKDWIKAGNAEQSADTLISTGKIPELIMVLPDGNGHITPGEWANSFNRRQLMETYIVTDLVKYVDQKYRTIPLASSRAIGGLSMGGFGAMNIAVHHPNIFGTVISLGGYYRAEGSVWGNNANYIRQNSPIDVLPGDRQAWKLHIFLGAATQDQPYYSDTTEFTHTLNALSIPYRLNIQKGSHSWNIWQVQIYFALLWIKWG